MSDKTWNTTRTGLVWHSFTTHGQALCRKNIKVQGDDLFLSEEQVDNLTSQAHIRSTKCHTCTRIEAAHQARVEASMAPVNEYDQVCEGVVTSEEGTKLRKWEFSASLSDVNGHWGVVFGNVQAVTEDGAIDAVQAKYEGKPVWIAGLDVTPVEEDVMPVNMAAEHTHNFKATYNGAKRRAFLICTCGEEKDVAPVKEIEPQAIEEDAACGTGIEAGSTWVPTADNKRFQPGTTITVRYVKRSEPDGTPYVAYDIHNPADWRGRPYTTSSALNIELFRKLFQPQTVKSSRTTYEVTITYTLPGSTGQRTWRMLVTPDAPSISVSYKAVMLAEQDFQNSGPKGAEISEVHARPVTGF